jgi:D-glycero-D-manno-heptose 1,7-bisphosphate phosphatase
MIPVWHASPFNSPKPAVFLDRDGTLNVDTGYVFLRSEWHWIDGVISSLAKLRRAGFSLIVVSNQAGIARGYYSASDVIRLHELIQRELSSAKAEMDGYLFCPHHPDFTGDCDCRKPRAAMIVSAAQYLNIDLGRSIMIGDSRSDIDAGRAAGLQSYQCSGGPNIGRCSDLSMSNDLLAFPKIVEKILASSV